MVVQEITDVQKEQIAALIEAVEVTQRQLQLVLSVLRIDPESDFDTKTMSFTKGGV